MFIVIPHAQPHYSIPAEFGDYNPEIHTVQYFRDFILFPEVSNSIIQFTIMPFPKLFLIYFSKDHGSKGRDFRLIDKGNAKFSSKAQVYTLFIRF